VAIPVLLLLCEWEKVARAVCLRRMPDRWLDYDQNKPIAVMPVAVQMGRSRAYKTDESHYSERRDPLAFFRADPGNHQWWIPW
jgi:hypothetical protein